MCARHRPSFLIRDLLHMCFPRWSHVPSAFGLTVDFLGRVYLSHSLRHLVILPFWIWMDNQ